MTRIASLCLMAILKLPVPSGQVVHMECWHADSSKGGCRGVEEPVDASEEPEPIMVDEEEQDELVEAILDANVGLRASDTRK